MREHTHLNAEIQRFTHKNKRSETNIYAFRNGYMYSCIVKTNICCPLSNKTIENDSELALATTSTFGSTSTHSRVGWLSNMGNHPVQTVLSSRLKYSCAFVSKSSSKGQMRVLDRTLLTEISKNTQFINLEIVQFVKRPWL